MRKLFVALAATLLLSVGVVGGAEAANENANCVGRARSVFNGQALGDALSTSGKTTQGIGDTISPNAQSNCGRR